MGSRRDYVNSLGAKRNWTRREWQIYEDLPWVMRRFVDVLIRIPRFARSSGQRPVVIADRRLALVERKLLEAKQQRAGRLKG